MRNRGESVSIEEEERSFDCQLITRLHKITLLVLPDLFFFEDMMTVWKGLLESYTKLNLLFHTLCLHHRWFLLPKLVAIHAKP